MHGRLPRGGRASRFRHQPTGAVTMDLIRLQNSDLVLSLALSLGGALLLAMRFRPKSWLGIAVEALAANLAAIAAVIAFELLLS
ncbi:conserved hypothetical protein [Burkholderia thailandensis E264]|uniref:Uncharacterized protein n=2 Tax=Burkholderia thailandensis TaxID=57975 RepID=Q2SY82_BURTA|nr:conserved hypothetical protein [Burkholderia thailandensis E264]